MSLLHKWTETEIIFLKDNFDLLSYKEVAIILNRTESSIQHKCVRLGLKTKRRPLLSNENFGDIVVLSSMDNDSLECQCFCGTVFSIKRKSIRTGSVKSCGCLTRELRYKEPGVAAHAKIFATYRANAKSRSLEFSLTRDEVRNLVTKPCDICGDGPVPYNPYIKKDGSMIKGNSPIAKETADRAWILSNGIDRINNEIGYILSNCQTSCFPCNEMKMDTSYSVFLNQVRKIHQKQFKND